jgi:hypothetical protein
MNKRPSPKRGPLPCPADVYVRFPSLHTTDIHSVTYERARADAIVRLYMAIDLFELIADWVVADRAAAAAFLDSFHPRQG